MKKKLELTEFIQREIETELERCAKLVKLGFDLVPIYATLMIMQMRYKSKIEVSKEMIDRDLDFLLFANFQIEQVN